MKHIRVNTSKDLGWKQQQKSNDKFKEKNDSVEEY